MKIRTPEFKSLFESLPGIYVILNPDLVITAASNTYLTATNTKREKLIGRSFLEITSSNPNNEIFTNFLNYITSLNNKPKNGIPKSIEMLQYDIIRADGVLEERYWIPQTTPVYKSKEELDYIILELKDVTETARKQLIKNENRFSHTMDNMLEGVQIIDFDWKYIYVNDALVRHAKIQKSELLGYTIMDKYPGFDKSPLYKVFEKCFKERVTVRLKNEFIFPDNSKGWFELSLQPIPEGIFILSVDITDKIKAEETAKKILAEKEELAQRMAGIINTLPAHIALLDENAIIIDVNDGWKKFSNQNGYHGEDYCIGSNYINISKKADGRSEKDGNIVASGIESVLKKENPEFIYEYPCHSPKEKRWFRMIVTPIIGKAFKGAVVMHMDITQLHQLEMERLKSKTDEHKKITKAMLHAQELERHYLGQELHDNINQLLVGSKLYLELEGERNGQIKEVIKYPIELINKTINEIRLLSKKLVSPVIHFKLHDLIEDLLSNYSKNSTTTTHFNYDFSDTLISDDLKLNVFRIIQEQLNNIAKHAKATEINISIAETNSTLSITVSDNGVGFNLANKANGIGISNMKNRVDSFKGKIEINSSEGCGCKTTIHIPLLPLQTTDTPIKMDKKSIKTN